MFRTSTDQYRKIRRVLLMAGALAAPLYLVSGPESDAAPKARHRPARRPAAKSPARAPRVALRPTPLPDGSGSMRLPSGWRITGAQNGMVSAEGPHGMVDLGIWCVVFTPEAAAQWWARPPVVAPYGDPSQVVRQVIPQFMAVAPQPGQKFRWVRLIDRAPAQWPNGKGAFLHYEWELTGKGRWQTVALVLLSPNGDGSYTYYSSSVSSPSSRFARDLPVLQQIWSSWKVSDHVFKERLANALESMRETGRILRSATANRQDAQDRANRAWSHVTRGTWVIEDTETGRRYEVPHDDMRNRLERMNRQEGYERYREVPYRDLNR
jgi:hypothetical protein